jgi:hypothetical protein
MRTQYTAGGRINTAASATVRQLSPGTCVCVLVCRLLNYSIFFVCVGSGLVGAATCVFRTRSPPPSSCTKACQRQGFRLSSAYTTVIILPYAICYIHRHNTTSLVPWHAVPLPSTKRKMRHDKGLCTISCERNTYTHTHSHTRTHERRRQQISDFLCESDAT